MYYIWASRRDDLTKHYWNRRKGEWQLDLTSSCYYPTRRGVDRIHSKLCGDYWTLGSRFHECGWTRIPA